MANSLVVRKGTDLAKRIKALRAAQYVRMSTDFQRYSIENQAAAIATYAQQKHFTIVRTYMDEGRSGLRIKGRAGLTKLIDDVQSGRTDFDHILVYDISRWGRFQDVDESAHYEFICKQNGIRVAYCAEQFDNDGSLLSSIIKNIKRVMAAEYSRELSVKVHTGQCRIAGLGYRVGGPLNFGLRRELIGEDQNSKGQLSRGQRKALQTDRVRLQPGSEKEADTVRRIFHKYVVDRQSAAAIARQLNRQKIPNHHGRRWTDGMIYTVLRNENYIGNIVHNRTSRRLGQKQIHNPDHLWVRREGAIAPIVDRQLFGRARKIMADQYISIADEQMLVRLRVTLSKRGKLNSTIINTTPGLPCVSSYCKHFGSLRKAFDLIGYTSPRDCDWIDTRQHWFDVLEEHATRIADAIEVGPPQNDGTNSVSLPLDRKMTLTLMVVRQSRRGPHHTEQWRIYRTRPIQPGLLAVIRLDRANKTIKDYVLMPAAQISGSCRWLSDGSLNRLDAVLLRSADELANEIKASCRKQPRRRYPVFAN
ncbi:MAG: recombinase family protein [Rhizobiales bacterium]|nr:recombinase family protein [Hyphomicrobiales bacterium]